VLDGEFVDAHCGKWNWGTSKYGDRLVYLHTMGPKMRSEKNLLVLIIDQDKIAFGENLRTNGLIILTLDSLLMSIIG
jgi:hypothetical protein